MRRLLPVLVFSAVLLFAVNASAPAMPLMPGEAGQFTVFADLDTWYSGLVLGAGYSLTGGLMVGGYYDSVFPAFGVFADLSFGPLLVDGELEFYEGSYWGKVSACYASELAPFALGAGLGSDFGTLGGAPFVRLAADFAARDSLRIYAAVDYYYNDDWTACQVGLAWAF